MGAGQRPQVQQVRKGKHAGSSLRGSTAVESKRAAAAEGAAVALVGWLLLLLWGGNAGC